jgi:hypothetical protein
MAQMATAVLRALLVFLALPAPKVLLVLQALTAPREPRALPVALVLKALH